MMSNRSRRPWNPRARFSKSMKMARDRSPSATAYLACEWSHVAPAYQCNVMGQTGKEGSSGVGGKKGRIEGGEPEKAAAPARTAGAARKSSVIPNPCGRDPEGAP